MLQSNVLLSHSVDRWQLAIDPIVLEVEFKFSNDSIRNENVSTGQLSAGHANIDEFAASLVDRVDTRADFGDCTIGPIRETVERRDRQALNILCIGITLFSAASQLGADRSQARAVTR